MSKNENGKFYIPYECDWEGARAMGCAREDFVTMMIGSRWTKGVYVPATEEQYHRYMSEVWSTEKRIERSRRCKVISSKTGKLVRCTKSCRECKRTRTGSHISLDGLIETGFDVPSGESMEDSVLNKIVLEQVLTAIEEVNPTDRTIAELIGDGETRQAISEQTGIAKSTINDRFKRSQRIAATVASAEDIF